MIKDGKVPRLQKAFMADALGTTFGAVLGSSTVTTYVESASGVAQGGRSGLMAFTTLGSLIANNTIYNSKMYTFGGSGGSAIYAGPNNEIYGNDGAAWVGDGRGCVGCVEGWRGVLAD